MQALSINGYWWYAADRELGPRHRARPERGAGAVGRGAPRSVRGDGVRGAAASRSRRRAARGRREAAGPARRLDRRARRRRGRDAAEVRPVLGQGGGAGRAGVHAPERIAEPRQAERPGRPRRSRQHHRQPARDHLLSLAARSSTARSTSFRACASAARTPAAICRRIWAAPTWPATCGRRPTAPTRRGHASTSSASCSWTRWCSRTKGSAISSRRWGWGRSSTAPTCRSTGRSPSIWCSTRRGSATRTRRRFSVATSGACCASR